MLISRTYKSILFFSVVICTVNLLATQTASAKSFLWQVSSATSESYILGSIHVGQQQLYPLAPAIEQAFSKSDVLVVEADTAKMNSPEMQTMMLTQGMYQGDKTIFTQLKSDELKALQDYTQKYAIPIEPLAKMKPGILAMTLSMMHMVKLGFSPQHGIDFHFLNQARNKKQVLELESVEQQLELILDPSVDGRMLKYTLSSMDKVEQQLDQLVRSWKHGDTAQLEKLIIQDPLNEDPALESLYQKLFDDRNINMANKIKKLLNTDKRYFVVVGAGHLVGETGLIHLLSKAGYDVNQI